MLRTGYDSSAAADAIANLKGPVAYLPILGKTIRQTKNTAADNAAAAASKMNMCSTVAAPAVVAGKDSSGRWMHIFGRMAVDVVLSKNE